jgi:hypothetical protein
VSELLHEYLIEKGITDRHGKQRRQAGSYLRTLAMLDDLAGQIRVGLATAAFDDEDTPLWDDGSIRRRLQAIADSPDVPGGARVAALRLLGETAPPAPTHDAEFYEKLHEMTDEELERELGYLRVPISTGRKRGPGSTPLDDLRALIWKVGSQEKITDHDLADIYDSANRRFHPPTPWPTSPEECE